MDAERQNLIHRPMPASPEFPKDNNNRKKVLIAAGVVAFFLVGYFFVFKDKFPQMPVPALKTLGGVIVDLQGDNFVVSVIFDKEENFYTINTSRKTKFLKTDAGTVPPYIQEVDFQSLAVGNNVAVTYQESDNGIEAQKVEVINFPLPPKEVMERVSPNQAPPPPPK